MPRVKLVPETARTSCHYPRLSSDMLRARRCVLTSDVRSFLSLPLDGAAAAAERRVSRAIFHACSRAIPEVTWLELGLGLGLG